MTVDWPVHNPKKWVTTTSEQSETSGITRYSLSENPILSLYEYSLWFTNLDHYDYYFVDETGDIYECNTFSNANHVVQYSSDKPTIQKVKGS